jgi:Domain of unknown function (DUF4340)
LRAFRAPLLLMVVAVLLAGVYLILDVNADPVQAGKLYRFVGDERLREITLTNQYGSFTFEKENGKWVMTQPARYRVNQQKAKLVEQALLELPVNRILTGEAKDYGLAEPVTTVGMVSDRNTRHTLYIGNLTPSKAQVYLKDSRSQRVAVTDLGNVAQFDGSLEAYRDKEIFSIDKSKIARITLYKGGQKQVAVERIGNLDWQMTYPYQSPARRVELSQLVAQMRNWSIAGYPAGDINLGTLGLEVPEQVLEVGDDSGSTQQLEFGKVENGRVSVRIGGPQDIVELFAVDVNLDVLSADRLLFLAPLHTTIDRVSRIAVEYGGKQATFEVDHSVDPPRIMGNGSEIAYSEFVSFFVKYITLSADGHDAGGKAGAAYMTLTTTCTDGSTQTLTLENRDANTFYMKVAGKAEFFMNKEGVTQLVYFLETALAAKK